MDCENRGGKKKYGPLSETDGSIKVHPQPETRRTRSKHCVTKTTVSPADAVMQNAEELDRSLLQAGVHSEEAAMKSGKKEDDEPSEQQQKMMVKTRSSTRKSFIGDVTKLPVAVKRKTRSEDMKEDKLSRGRGVAETQDEVLDLHDHSIKVTRRSVRNVSRLAVQGPETGKQQVEVFVKAQENNVKSRKKEKLSVDSAPEFPIVEKRRTREGFVSRNLNEGNTDRNGKKGKLSKGGVRKRSKDGEAHSESFEKLENANESSMMQSQADTTRRQSKCSASKTANFSVDLKIRKDKSVNGNEHQEISLFQNCSTDIISNETDVSKETVTENENIVDNKAAIPIEETKQLKSPMSNDSHNMSFIVAAGIQESLESANEEAAEIYTMNLSRNCAGHEPTISADRMMAAEKSTPAEDQGGRTGANHTSAEIFEAVSACNCIDNEEISEADNDRNIFLVKEMEVLEVAQSQETYTEVVDATVNTEAISTCGDEEEFPGVVTARNILIRNLEVIEATQSQEAKTEATVDATEIIDTISASKDDEEISVSGNARNNALVRSIHVTQMSRNQESYTASEVIVDTTGTSEKVSVGKGDEENSGGESARNILIRNLEVVEVPESQEAKTEATVDATEIIETTSASKDDEEISANGNAKNIAQVRSIQVTEMTKNQETYTASEVVVDATWASGNVSVGKGDEGNSEGETARNILDAEDIEVIEFSQMQETYNEAIADPTENIGEASPFKDDVENIRSILHVKNTEFVDVAQSEEAFAEEIVDATENIEADSTFKVDGENFRNILHVNNTENVEVVQSEEVCIEAVTSSPDRATFDSGKFEPGLKISGDSSVDIQGKRSEGLVHLNNSGKFHHFDCLENQEMAQVIVRTDVDSDASCFEDDSIVHANGKGKRVLNVPVMLEECETPMEPSLSQQMIAEVEDCMDQQECNEASNVPVTVVEDSEVISDVLCGEAVVDAEAFMENADQSCKTAVDLYDGSKDNVSSVEEKFGVMDEQEHGNYSTEYDNGNGRLENSVILASLLVMEASGTDRKSSCGQKIHLQDEGITSCSLARPCHHNLDDMYRPEFESVVDSFAEVVTSISVDYDTNSYGNKMSTGYKEENCEDAHEEHVHSNAICEVEHQSTPILFDVTDDAGNEDSEKDIIEESKEAPETSLKNVDWTTTPMMLKVKNEEVDVRNASIAGYNSKDVEGKENTVVYDNHGDNERFEDTAVSPAPLGLDEEFKRIDGKNIILGDVLDTMTTSNKNHCVIDHKDQQGSGKKFNNTADIKIVGGYGEAISNERGSESNTGKNDHEDAQKENAFTSEIDRVGQVIFEQYSNFFQDGDDLRFIVSEKFQDASNGIVEDVNNGGCKIGLELENNHEKDEYNTVDAVEKEASENFEKLVEPNILDVEEECDKIEKPSYDEKRSIQITPESAFDLNHLKTDESFIEDAETSSQTFDVIPLEAEHFEGNLEKSDNIVEGENESSNEIYSPLSMFNAVEKEASENFEKAVKPNILDVEEECDKIEKPSYDENQSIQITPESAFDLNHLKTHQSFMEDAETSQTFNVIPLEAAHFEGNLEKSDNIVEGENESFNEIPSPLSKFNAETRVEGFSFEYESVKLEGFSFECQNVPIKDGFSVQTLEENGNEAKDIFEAPSNELQQVSKTEVDKDCEVGADTGVNYRDTVFCSASKLNSNLMNSSFDHDVGEDTEKLQQRVVIASAEMEDESLLECSRMEANGEFDQKVSEANKVISSIFVEATETPVAIEKQQMYRGDIIAPVECGDHVEMVDLKGQEVFMSFEGNIQESIQKEECTEAKDRVSEEKRYYCMGEPMMCAGKHELRGEEDDIGIQLREHESDQPENFHCTKDDICLNPEESLEVLQCPPNETTVNRRSLACEPLNMTDSQGIEREEIKDISVPEKIGNDDSFGDGSASHVTRVGETIVSVGSMVADSDLLYGQAEIKGDDMQQASQKETISSYWKDFEEASSNLEVTMSHYESRAHLLSSYPTENVTCEEHVETEKKKGAGESILEEHGCINFEGVNVFEEEKKCDHPCDCSQLLRGGESFGAITNTFQVKPHHLNDKGISNIMRDESESDNCKDNSEIENEEMVINCKDNSEMENEARVINCKDNSEIENEERVINCKDNTKMENEERVMKVFCFKKPEVASPAKLENLEVQGVDFEPIPYMEASDAKTQEKSFLDDISFESIGRSSKIKDIDGEFLSDEATEAAVSAGHLADNNKLEKSGSFDTKDSMAPEGIHEFKETDTTRVLEVIAKEGAEELLLGNLGESFGIEKDQVLPENESIASMMELLDVDEAKNVAGEVKLSKIALETKSDETVGFQNFSRTYSLFEIELDSRNGSSPFPVLEHQDKGHESELPFTLDEASKQNMVIGLEESSNGADDLGKEHESELPCIVDKANKWNIVIGSEESGNGVVNFGKEQKNELPFTFDKRNQQSMITSLDESVNDEFDQDKEHESELTFTVDKANMWNMVMGLEESDNGAASLGKENESELPLTFDKAKEQHMVISLEESDNGAFSAGKEQESEAPFTVDKANKLVTGFEESDNGVASLSMQAPNGIATHEAVPNLIESCNLEAQMGEINNLVDDTPGKQERRTCKIGSHALGSVENLKHRPLLAEMKENTPAVKKFQLSNNDFGKSVTSVRKRRALQDL